MNLKLWWTLLKDLNPDDLKKAVIELSKNLTELYTDSNLIAIVRKGAQDQQRIRLTKPADDFPLLEDRHSSKPPKEWTDLIDKIAKEKGVS